MSALSINKQVFLKLHPDIEKAILKFYRVKQEQRDETFARVSRELLAQEEAKNDAFLQKLGDVAQMVHRKALTVFTDRENRAAVNRKMTIGTPRSIPSLQLAQTEPTDTSIHESSYIGSANLRPRSSILQSPKFKFLTEDSERPLFTAGCSRKQSSNWFESQAMNLNLQKIEERPSSSPAKQVTNRPVSPTLDSMIRMSIISEQSLTANLKHRLSIDQSSYHGNQLSSDVKSPTLIVENQKGRSFQNFSESVNGNTDNLLIDRARIKEILKIQKKLINSSDAIK